MLNQTSREIGRIELLEHIFVFKELEYDQNLHPMATRSIGPASQRNMVKWPDCLTIRNIENHGFATQRSQQLF